MHIIVFSSETDPGKCFVLGGNWLSYCVKTL